MEGRLRSKRASLQELRHQWQSTETNLRIKHEKKNIAKEKGTANASELGAAEGDAASPEKAPRKKRAPSLNRYEPFGRPTAYRAEYCALLYEHMRNGYSFESFAGIVGVCRATVFNWCRDYPDFQEARDRAHSACLLFWEGVAIDNLISTPDAKLNTGVWFANMKNRFGWKDKTELSGDSQNPIAVNGQVEIKNMTDEQLKEMARSLTNPS